MILHGSISIYVTYNDYFTFYDLIQMI